MKKRMVVWRWLDNVAYRDPIERKLAPIFQVLLIGIIVAFLVNLAIEAVASADPPTNLMGAVLFLLLCASILFFLRRGYFKVVSWAFLIVLLLANHNRLTTAPLEDVDEAVITFFLPIVIAGILGRIPLLVAVVITCVFVFRPYNAERLDNITLTIFAINIVLISFFIDLLGSTLRHELKLANIQNEELQQAHLALENSSAELFKLNERLTITLKSIGDAVITTDANVRITLLNGVAEQLTGWTQAEAEGQALATVFHIINEYTREIVESPADKVIREGVTVGLANHTLLITKDGREIPIDDSGAPIIDKQGKIAGVVLVFRDITERKEAEEQEKELVASNERQRLARELHDSVSQTLFSTNMIAGSLPALFQANPERGLQQVAEIQELTQGAMAEMRTLLLELRPENIVRTKLSILLRQLANVGQTRQKIAVSIQIEGDDGQFLPEAVHFALYRIAQESMNNVISHSKAKQLRIRLKRSPDHAELVIVDNGQGFDVKQMYAGLGLTSMRERAESINATLKMQSKVGTGTRIRVVWTQ